MLIQSCYTDADLSSRRLDISVHTSVASLAYQTLKPVLHIVQHPDDQHAVARIALYESTGCSVVPIWRDNWRLYGEDWELPTGRKLVSRIDDDDVIAIDYCEILHRAAPTSGEHALLWPLGYVFWRNKAYRLNHPGTQFVSLVTDLQTDPHQQGHWLYRSQWPSVVVSDAPGWIWIRHGASATPTLAKYRRTRVNRIDSSRIPINLRAVSRVIEHSGEAAGHYPGRRMAYDTE